MQVPINRKKYFWLAKKLKLYFIHVPKCGGSFVEKNFMPYIRKCPTQRLAEARGHKTWLEYKKIFDKHGLDFSEAITFSVIRNPWDWHVSWFHYVRNDEGGRKSGHKIESELFKDFEFSDYVAWLEDPDAKRSPQGYMVRQVSDWLIDENGDVVIENILRQETLESDLIRFVDKYELSIKITPSKENASKRGQYREYYNSQTKEIIRQRHQRDLELFNYQF